MVTLVKVVKQSRFKRSNLREELHETFYTLVVDKLGGLRRLNMARQLKVKLQDLQPTTASAGNNCKSSLPKSDEVQT